MLLKLDVPLSHRIALVAAITLTYHALVALARASQLGVLGVCAVTAWIIVLYTSIQRRRWRAEVPNGNIEVRYNAFDRMIQPVQTWFNEASITTTMVYWGAVMLAAILIYRFVR